MRFHFSGGVVTTTFLFTFRFACGSCEFLLAYCRFPGFMVMTRIHMLLGPWDLSCCHTCGSARTHIDAPCASQGDRPMTLLHVHSSSPVPVIVHVTWLIAQQDLCDALLNRSCSLLRLVVSRCWRNVLPWAWVHRHPGLEPGRT